MRSRSPVTWWLTGSGLDFGADTAWYVMLGWLAVRADDIPMAVILALSALPRMLVLVGGALADRWGVVRTTNHTLVIRAGLMAVLAGALALAPNPSGLLLAGLALLFGVVDAVHMPAMSSIVAHLLPEDEEGLSVANGRAMTVNTGAEVLAAPVAGFFIASTVPSAGVLVFVVTLTGAFICFHQLRQHVPTPDPAATPSGLLNSIREGAAFFKDRTFAVILGTYAISNLCTTAPVFFGVPLQARDLEWSGAVYGAVAFTYSLGIGIGGVAAGAVSSRRGSDGRGNPPLTYSMALLAAAALGVVAMSLSREPWQVGIAAACTGLLVAPTGAWMKAYVQKRTPTEALARVGSLIQVGIFSAIPIGHLVYGGLAAVGGARLAGSVLGGLLLVAAFVGWVIVRAPARQTIRS